MGTTRAVQPVTSCAFCGGPMPPPSATGRPAVFCSGACRKAAHEARRTGAPGAFEVKVVDRVVVESHDLASCVARVIAMRTGDGSNRQILLASLVNFFCKKTP